MVIDWNLIFFVTSDSKAKILKSSADTQKEILPRKNIFDVKELELFSKQFDEWSAKKIEVPKKLRKRCKNV